MQKQDDTDTTIEDVLPDEPDTELTEDRELEEEEAEAEEEPLRNDAMPPDEED